MSFAHLLKQRTSIRAYLDCPVSEATIHELLDAARWAPSGGNLQPWKVLVVSGAAREAVSRLASQRMKENPEGEANERPIYPPNLDD